MDTTYGNSSRRDCGSSGFCSTAFDRRPAVQSYPVGLTGLCKSKPAIPVMIENKSRVGKGRPAGSMELRVSPSPSKIPYGGFSPVRLQTDSQWRPSTTSQGLSAVHIHPMIPSYTPPQFVLPEVRDPRRDLPVLEPRGSIWHDSQQRQHVHPEALGSPAGYVVPSGHRLLRPHPPL